MDDYDGPLTVDRGVLLIPQGATAGEIASVAVRHAYARDGRPGGEHAVRLVVEKHGHAYVPPQAAESVSARRSSAQPR